MACKHFWIDTVRVSEMGSRQPLTHRAPHCRITGRQPTDPGWESRCRSTRREGPCWSWSEQHGDVPDPEF